MESDNVLRIDRGEENSWLNSWRNLSGWGGRRMNNQQKAKPNEISTLVDT